MSSNKNHFEMGIKNINDIKKKYRDILDSIITKKLRPVEFKQAFKPEREDIKTMICF